KIPRHVWESVRDFYVRTQVPTGPGEAAWTYGPHHNNFPTLTMTTAGLCGLLIAGMELNAGREVIQKDGTAAQCGMYEENQPATRALNWVSNHFRVQTAHLYYNLYGLERAGRLSGLRFFGNIDWYREGCKFLVENQREDGSWRDRGQDWPVVSTSSALLFLSKGRTPVLVSKLVHGGFPRRDGDTDWNNDRNDVRHLVEFVVKSEVFKKQPLAWQIFDAMRPTVTSEQDLLDLVGELLQSPVVYFNGHKRPRFTDREKELLKKYVEHGGFILAEACCGRPEFDRGFRELAKELWPDN